MKIRAANKQWIWKTKYVEQYYDMKQPNEQKVVQNMSKRHVLWTSRRRPQISQNENFYYFFSRRWIDVLLWMWYGHH